MGIYRSSFILPLIMVGTCTVVIPTYNEEKNIAEIATAIRQMYPDYRIIFMDDNSTDRGKEIVEELNDPLTKMIVRDSEDRGLGISVIEGFRTADTDYAICMDCDFQHPVETLGKIVEKLDAGADLCVGKRRSRKVMGFKRSMGSHITELFCKITFKLHGVQTTKDMMSGLFGIRTEVFQPSINDNWDKYERKGWKVLMDLMKYFGRKVLVSYVEYDFASRREGESHINPNVPIMTFHQLWGFGKFLAKFFCKVYHKDYYAMYPEERKH